MKRFCTGIHIEGIGDPTGTGSANGYMFATANSMLLASGTQSYDWTPRLKMPTASVEDRREPFNPGYSRSSYTFELHGHDDVAEMFLSKANRAMSELASDITASDTDVDLGVSGLTGVVYVGQETILLVTDNGDGTYSDCERGMYGSTAKPHVAGTNVYDRVPEWQGRLVRMYQYGFDDDHLEQRWLGKIHIDEDISQDGMTISMPCTVANAGNEAIRLGRWRPSVVVEGIRYRKTDTIPLGPGSLSFELEPTVTKPTSSEQSSELYQSIIQVGPQLFEANAKGSGDSKTFAKRYGILLGTQAEPLNDGASLGNRSAECSELFAVDKEAGVSSLYNLQNATDYTSGAEYHPAAIYAALKLSTDAEIADPDNFDLLRAPWSMETKWQFESGIVDTIWQLIEETPYLQVHQWVLGFDLEPVQVEQKLQQLLRNHLLYEGINEKGELTLKRFNLADVSTFSSALDNRLAAIPSERLGQSTGSGSTVDQFEVVVGELPWKDGKPIQVNAEDGATFRASKYKRATDARLDFDTIPRDKDHLAKRLVESTALVQHFALDRVRIRVADHLETGCDLTVGAYATLDDLPLKKPYLVDADGNRISTTRDDVNWLCQIIGRRFRPAERTYDLTLLVVGAALVRLRAPSGVITGYTDNGDGTSTFQLDRTALDQSADDGTFFTAGDDLIVTNPDGTTWESTELEVTASSGSFVDVEGTLSSVPSSWEWHVLELAPLDTDGSGAGYSNPGLNGAYSNIERVYAFLANSPTSSNVDPTLGDAGLEADIYGA